MHFSRFVTGSLFTLLVFLLGPGQLHAQNYEGTLNRTGFRHGACDVRSMDVRYRFSVIMGDPIINGSYQWEAGADTQPDCLPPEVSVWLEIQHTGATRWVEVDPAEVEAGAGWAYNVAGSPSLGEVFCNLGGGGCLDAAAAADLWSDGIEVVGFRLVGGEAASIRRVREAEEERRREAAEQRREEEERRAREEAEARERAEAREQARRDSILAAVEAREGRQAAEEARREAEREAEEERRRREVEEHNEELAESADSIEEDAEDLMEETPEEIETAATAGAIGVSGFVGQMWEEGLMVGASVFTGGPPTNENRSVWGVVIWNPTWLKGEWIIDWGDLLNPEDFDPEDVGPVVNYDMGATLMLGLEIWDWMGVYDDDMRGMIPFPSVGVGGHLISGSVLDETSPDGFYPSIGAGINWGGKASGFAVALEVHKYIGLDPGDYLERHQDPDWTMRDDILLQFGFAFASSFFTEAW